MPGPAVGVPDALAVLVPVGVLLALVVAVAVAVVVAVAAGAVAPSSRKTIKGFAHQLILVKLCVADVGVGAAPPNGLEQALKNRHPRKIPAARERPRR